VNGYELPDALLRLIEDELGPDDRNSDEDARDGWRLDRPGLRSREE
jgi:hypothetical protein